MRSILHADQRPKQNHKNENLPAHPQELYLLGRELGLLLNQGNIHSPIFEVSKKVIYLLRHSRHVCRKEDGAVQLWRINENLQDHFEFCHHWSGEKWKKSIARGGVNKER